MKTLERILIVFLGMNQCCMVTNQFLVLANRIKHTPNCFCPSINHFPTPNSKGISKVTWCGYELGPECEIQRGYICDIREANTEATFQSPNCLGAAAYCVPYKKLKACGGKGDCLEYPNCKRSMIATEIALEKQRKGYQSKSKF
jgi:hypothetical protein